MRKILALLVILLLLSGCTVQPADNRSLQNNLEKAVSSASTISLPSTYANNARKALYNYYLPRGVAREERDSTSNLFIIYGNTAIMTLDIAGVIASNIYKTDGLRDVEELASRDYEKVGVMVNSAGRETPYRVVVKCLDSKEAYIMVQTTEFLFTVTCPIVEADETLYEMIKIVRTCQVETEKVLADYSPTDGSNSGAKIIRLFNEVLPESGYIIDYIDDWKSDPSFNIIDRTEIPADTPSIDDIVNPDNPEGMDDDMGENADGINNENPGENNQ